MKALTIGGAMIDTIAIIESDRIERMAMLKHDVDDIRLFYESDLRFLEQF